jgi:AcrR family transcriptional regulator
MGVMTSAKEEPKTGLREMTRASVRDQVAERALQLFDENGFDATTIGDIAAAVGMSARTFFRYFPAKEDVVVGDPALFGTLVRDAAAARPASEPAWTTLRRAFDALDLTAAEDVARGLRTMRVMMSTASLRARNVEKHIAWAALLEPVIVAKLGGPAETQHFRAQTLIHAALSCLDVALAEWTRRDGATPAAALLDEAFGTLKA